ncbi:MAG: DEAD/DEAH box helicase [Pseudomonadota bacterium]
MAFKKPPKRATVPDSPDELFRELPRRKYPDVLPHQQSVMRKYANDFLSTSDVAIQLPTGSGKTLVGILIAEWRRRKFGERVVYLCPTKQLVNQTVEQAFAQLSPCAKEGFLLYNGV